MTARDEFETLTPEFGVHINGSEKSIDAITADLISLQVLDDVDAMSMFALSISAWNSAESKVKWIDDELFQEGNPVKITMGYHNHLETLFSGEITALEPYFPEGRTPILTVRGYDRRHRLMRQRKTRSYTNLKDSAIANQLATQATLQAETEDTGVVLPYVLQHNQTDYDFLIGRARLIGYELVINDRTLLFRPRKIQEEATLTLRRDIELLEFRPRMTTMSQIEEFTVRGWNPKEKKEIVARSSAGEEPRKMGGTVSGPANVRERFSGTGGTRVTMPVQSQDEADQLAKQALSEVALDYIRAEGLCIGDPRLRAGTVVNVEGIGVRFSGPYYVCSADHRFSMSKGYRTAIFARRNAT
ncbi:MAG: phage late control D family protein [Nitrosospira sp.]|nr:phage late control D family protein [Nitrosospira sp.]